MYEKAINNLLLLYDNYVIMFDYIIIFSKEISSYFISSIVNYFVRNLLVLVVMSNHYKFFQSLYINLSIRILIYLEKHHTDIINLVVYISILD